VVWVTTVPQSSTCVVGGSPPTRTPDLSKEAIDLRLKQYLGLDPSWQYDVFVELWVDPGDLFRPCVDPQTDDTSCDYRFGD